MTATVRLNEIKHGVEIRFPAKPPRETIDRLKAQGFHWSGRGGCWYKRQSPAAIAFANTFAGDAPVTPSASEIGPDPFDLAVEDRMAEACGLDGLD